MVPGKFLRIWRSWLQVSKPGIYILIYLNPTSIPLYLEDIFIQVQLNIQALPGRYLLVQNVIFQTISGRYLLVKHFIFQIIPGRYYKVQYIFLSNPWNISPSMSSKSNLEDIFKSRMSPSLYLEDIFKFIMSNSFYLEDIFKFSMSSRLYLEGIFKISMSSSLSLPGRYLQVQHVFQSLPGRYLQVQHVFQPPSSVEQLETPSRHQQLKHYKKTYQYTQKDNCIGERDGQRVV